MSNPEPEQSAPDDASTAEAPTAAVEGKRPVAVTAAAVIAFVLAVYEVAAAVVLFIRADLVPGPTALWYAVAVVHLVFAGLLVWGGIAALRGQTNRILVLTAVAVAVVMVLTMIVEVAYGARPGELVLLLLYAVMAVLVTRPQSKEFFVSRGASSASGATPAASDEATET